MKRILIAAVLTLSCTPFLAQAQEFQITDPTGTAPAEYQIADVQVQGNERTRSQFIINASSLNIGSDIIYPGDAISTAVERLYRSGLFSDIKIYVTEQTATEISLLIEVEEQPRILEYKLKNIKRSQRRDLEDIITLTPGTVVSDAAVGRVKNTIKRFYKEKGYWYTEIDTEIKEVEDANDRVRVIFNIDAGDRLEVKDIEFNGNEAFSNRKLRRKIKPLKEDAWWKIFGKKVFKEEDFEEGKESVLSFYRANGYTDVRILKDSVYTYDYKGDKEGIKVLLNIEEGPKYKVRNITFDGNTVYEDATLREALGFQKGDVFNQQKFEENVNINKDNTDLNSLYQNVGYLFFQAIPNIEKVAEDSLDIHFDIYEDEIATIKNVDFTGNTRTHDDVVRRTLRTVPGNKYSRSAIIRTIRELGTLGFFDPQGIEPDVRPNRQDKTVDVTYRLDDTESTSNFELSGGYGGSGIGVIISTRVNFNNFSLQRALKKEGWNPIPMGDGQQLSLGVQVTGTGYQSYSFGFSEPWFRGRPTSVGFNVSYDFYNSRRSSFNVNSKYSLFSSNISIGRRLKWPDDYFSQRTVIGYQLYNIEGSSGALSAGNSNLFTIRQVIERNSLDNFISPNTGSKFTFSAEAAPPLPGFSEFYKFRADYQHHVPLVDRLVMTTQVQYGYIGYFTKDKRSELNRFLVGGTQLQQRQSFLYDNIDLRGYPGSTTESIGHVVDGRKIGGRMFSKYSLELRYPAVTNDQVQIIPYTFTDAGNSYLDFNTFDPFSVKRSVGVGVRLYLPILGLIDLSYGYRLDGVNVPNSTNDVQPGQWEFLFNIGAPF
ncbi:outer membrane protein assembly factor BamA [Gracilimonas mengyeensis]|uniref:outer membrane protein assembly factor BamA n=1 Tax=Gracilimonas mengyeensis TaxID=1302730 RepID=UPI001FE64C73|nr:outer membrane protein assembly factor BamA [Gracilimonas mengyeensis]